MKKLFLIFLLATTIFQTYAQYFEWAISGTSIGSYDNDKIYSSRLVISQLH